jgi:hypothetical protein
MPMLQDLLIRYFLMVLECSYKEKVLKHLHQVILTFFRKQIIQKIFNLPLASSDKLIFLPFDI